MYICVSSVEFALLVCHLTLFPLLNLATLYHALLPNIVVFEGHAQKRMAFLILVNRTGQTSAIGHDCLPAAGRRVLRDAPNYVAPSGYPGANRDRSEQASSQGFAGYRLRIHPAGCD